MTSAHPRARSYDPQRCAAELQERGELEWASTVLAKKAFRLALTVPGGVVLSLAGVAGPAGREVAWPQVRVRVKEVVFSAVRKSC